MDGLRQAIRRVDQQKLEPEDWPLIRALLWNQLVRSEGRQEREIAKISAAAAAKDTSEAGCDASESSPGAESTSSSSSSGSHTTGSTSSSGSNAAGSDEPASPSSGDGETDPSDSKKPKGHGRNGASAYSKAQHFCHAQALGVIGSLCEACRRGKMYPYREKIVLRIVGQPLFSAEVHHHEQARCRGCGHIVRAESPAYVREGLGTDYIRYDWSACAMLMVMHYFGGAPFKRIESLHDGWGVPMPDANQWELVNAGDDLLLPLYRALEQHAIQKSTNFRIDDTGAMVISLKKQIDAEISALESLGESTKDVRTGINATGSYWETPNGPVLLFYTGRHHAGEIVDQAPPASPALEPQAGEVHRRRLEELRPRARRQVDRVDLQCARALEVSRHQGQAPRRVRRGREGLQAGLRQRRQGQGARPDARRADALSPGALEAPRCRS